MGSKVAPLLKKGMHAIKFLSFPLLDSTHFYPDECLPRKVPNPETSSSKTASVASQFEEV